MGCYNPPLLGEVRGPDRRLGNARLRCCETTRRVGNGALGTQSCCGQGHAGCGDLSVVRAWQWIDNLAREIGLDIRFLDSQLVSALGLQSCINCQAPSIAASRKYQFKKRDSSQWC